ncbi:MAG TPA: hypothetical protein VGD56_03900 [Gemmatirosa sp.]
MRRWRSLSVVVVVCLVADACDPCSGVVGCTESPRVGVSGQIVDRLAYGAPVPGVHVQVIETGDSSSTGASATATTDGQGTWAVSMPARANGPVTVDVIVTPASPGTPYRVRGLSLVASTVHGQGNVVGRWAAQPYITYVGTLLDRTTEQPIVGATVAYTRVGGIAVDTTIVTQRTQQTTSLGYFTIDLRPLDFAPLIVDFSVVRQGQDTAYIRNVPIMPGYLWGPPTAAQGAQFRLGLGIEYFVQVVNDSTGRTSPGWLTFTRTGGVSVDQSRKAFPSQRGDTLDVSFHPTSAGVLVGDAFFEPAGTRDTVYFRNMQFATFDTAQPPSVVLHYRGTTAVRVARR